MKSKFIIVCSFSAALLCTAQALTLDTVTIGNPGNPNDSSTGLGSVAATYTLGKYEVTLAQYNDFLNAVADTDSFGLYNPSMGTNANSAGINRSGASGSFSYSVIGDGQRPVTYVNWFDAARFANWLHNGQPNTGIQNATTTEAGVYTLAGAISGVGFSRSGGAQYWIPNASEWYKAAYYDPASAGADANGTADYWLYPTRSDAIPNSRNGSITDPNSANFRRDDGLANGFNGDYAVTNSATFDPSQNYLTPVGAFTQAGSFYGTFDQGGNSWEWTDAVTGVNQVMRGGSWGTFDGFLQSANSLAITPTHEAANTGFRIAAAVPEPSAIFSFAVGAGVLLARRKRTAGV